MTKVSDITPAILAEYLRIPEVTVSDESYLETIIGIASNFIADYTGTDADSHQDYVIVALVLCQDMYDNRSLYVDSGNVNKVVEAILGLHSVNLIPRGDVNED